MSVVFALIATVFSVWAGIKASEAFHSGNKRKGWVLLTMWLIMYVVYLFTSLALLP